nr:hypothetical protein [uncultured Desulfobacter sp.]
MNVVFPVFPEDSCESELLQTQVKGGNLLDRILSTAVGLRQMGVFPLIVTSEEAVAKRVEPLKIQCLLKGVENRLPGDILTECSHAFARLTELRKNGQPVAVIDYRCPGLDADFILKALGDIVTSEADAFVGTKPVVDHPIQLFSLLSLDAVDLLLPIDDHGQDCVATRQIPMLLSSRYNAAVAPEDKMPALPSLMPMTLAGRFDQYTVSKGTMLSRNIERDRFFCDGFETSVSAVPLCSAVHDWRAVVVVSDDSKRSGLYVRKDAVQSGTKVFMAGLSGETVFCADIDSLEHHLTMPRSLFSFAGPVPQIPVTMTQSPFFLALVREAHKGEHGDIRLPLDLDAISWKRQKDKGMSALDRQSGQLLSSRQLFPPIWESNEMLYIFKTIPGPSLTDDPLKNIKPLLLPESVGKPIRTLLDLNECGVKE